MTRLYKFVFCPETTDDEKKDLAIQKRIRALHWVTPQMLCVPVNEEIPEVSDMVVKAITDIIEMDSKRVPRDKLAPGAASTSSMPSRSPRMSQPLPMTSCPP